MDQPYPLALLDLRDSDEARAANASVLDGHTAWGIKLPPALAAQCADNLAPTAEHEQLAAILAACLAPELPPPGATLVALGHADAAGTAPQPDLDSLGAIAVWFMRYWAVIGQADRFAEDDVWGRIIELATYSAPAEREQSDPSMPVSAPSALSVIAADSTLSLDTRVRTIIEYLQTGGFTDYPSAAQRARASLADDTR